MLRVSQQARAPQDMTTRPFAQHIAVLDWLAVHKFLCVGFIHHNVMEINEDKLPENLCLNR